MRALAAFFSLVGRPAVFWLGVIGLGSVALLLMALTQPEAPTAAHIDGAVLAALLFPGVAGFLAGALVRELQHCTFTWPLPAVRRQLAGGIATAAGVVTFITTALIAARGPGYPPLVLWPLCLGAFCLGGALVDPTRKTLTFFNAAVALVLVSRTVELGAFLQSRPLVAVAAALVAAGLYSWRLLAQEAFRRKPFLPTVPMPGAFSMAQTLRYEREKGAGRKAAGRRWRTAYLGARVGAWVRAAFYESYGDLGLGHMGRALGSTWALLLLIVAHAYAHMGDGSFWRALGYSAYDTFFQPPHLPPYGDDGPYEIVAIVVAAFGAILSFWNPVALRAGLAYPLSRRQLARVTYRASLLEAAISSLVVGGSLFVVGQAAGWAVGLPVRLDFLPLFFRALLMTLVGLPLVQWLRARAWNAGFVKKKDAYVVLMVGLIAFVAAVTVATFVLANALPSTVAQLVTLGVAWAASQALYRKKLQDHFTGADLA